MTNTLYRVCSMLIMMSEFVYMFVYIKLTFSMLLLTKGSSSSVPTLD